jgi:hypothetical protein
MDKDCEREQSFLKVRVERLRSRTGEYKGIQIMGRGILLWLLGVPLPIILLLAMCSHH